MRFGLPRRTGLSSAVKIACSPTPIATCSRQSMPAVTAVTSCQVVTHAKSQMTTASGFQIDGGGVVGRSVDLTVIAYPPLALQCSLTFSDTGLIDTIELQTPAICDADRMVEERCLDQHTVSSDNDLNLHRSSSYRFSRRQRSNSGSP